MSQEFGVFAKQAALRLEINTNTLRRWSIELERHGYEITRNEKGQRIYYERDMMVLVDFQKILGKTQSLENTGKRVVSMVKDQKNTEKMLGVIDEKDDKVSFTKDELEELLQRQSEKTAEAIFKRMDDVMEQRDRQLVQRLNDSMEQKRLELAAAEQEEKPSFWSKVFGLKPHQKPRRHDS